MLNILHFVYSATYPTEPSIAQVITTDHCDATQYNYIQANINAIGADLVSARSDSALYPGTDHAALQSSDLDDALCAIRHMTGQLSGEGYWYSDFAGSLKTHTHITGQGGAVPWTSVGAGPKSLVIHPEYPVAIWTTSRHGESPSGTNTGTAGTGQDVTSNVARNYYEWSSSEVVLQDYYLAVEFALPEDFTAWKTDGCVVIDYQTENADYLISALDVYIYKSGSDAMVFGGVGYASTSWAQITLDASQLGSWAAGDVICIYIMMKSSNTNYARLGKIQLNYT